MLSSAALHTDLEALGALELGSQDPTAVGWLLTGGACRWTKGGLQVLDLKCRGPSLFRKRMQRGYGVVCGFGPCVLSFPDLAGGVTIAVTVNDVLRGREVVAELAKYVLSTFGYVPTWPDMPMRVMVDAGRMARSEVAQPLLRSLGGLKLLRGGPNSGQTPTPACCCTAGCAGGLLALGTRCCSACGPGSARSEEVAPTTPLNST